MPQFTTEDVTYLKHGDRQIAARVFKPEGAGPFPVFVDLHGGAWNNGDLADRTGLGEYLAAHGVVMVTLNFRHAADGYPTSLADINYGVRWTKAHAKELKVDPSRVAIGGASSGGHLAMLAAMRPADPRYAAIPGPAGVDATVRAVVMQWPVINPLSRYRHAIRASALPNPPQFSVGMKEKHDTYWHTEAEMAEGNPTLILERGEKVVMPPAIWIQGRPDEVHDYHDEDSSFPGNEPERFVSNYRKAGGDIEITYFDNAQRGTEATHKPTLDFIKKHLG
ncbi:MAG TPA: alpha/beta hydrolase [Stellaceae bacterium]|jgi:acetyl esterase/lipase|nr:alpha/beta hydrolase [Stellaceae bacterium]